MKHSLSLLCLVITGSLFQTHNATAEHLLEHNPTPIELNSFSVSDEAYQVAGVYHIVDYSKKMESFFGKRINDDDTGVNNRNCAKYGYVASCGEGRTGTVVRPFVGLICYENCKENGNENQDKAESCSDYNMLRATDCRAHYVPAGDIKKVGDVTCYESCICDSSYYKYSEARCRGQGKVGGGEKCNSGMDYVYPGTFVSDGVGDDWRYTECVCADDYKLNACPEHGVCSKCGDEYRVDNCEDGYRLNSKQCVPIENCTDYPLTGTPPTGSWCLYQTCPDDSTKYKITGDNTDRGWKRSSDGKTCVPTPCPAGYTAGITECTSGSTKPDNHLNGWSGGLQCGLCRCNNTTDCSAYTLTTTSDPNANYTSCSTGCGSAAKTTYKFEGCKANYYNTENYWCSVPVTDCATLGYTKTSSSCSGKLIVRCPFDNTKVACFEKGA